MLISEKQQEANRQNAAHSTGPKTPEGKDAVRLNALQYGLRARSLLITGETQRITSNSGPIWKPSGNPKPAPNGSIWNRCPPPNGCSRGRPQARAVSAKSKCQPKSSSLCWVAFPRNARAWNVPSRVPGGNCSTYNRSARLSTSSSSPSKRCKPPNQPLRTLLFE
jgi:hypothetical protein